MYPPKKRCSGASLVEVLVTMTLTAVWLLSVVTLLINSIRYNKSAEEKSVVAQLANDMAERIRSNQTTLDSFETQENYSQALQTKFQQHANQGNSAKTPRELAQSEVEDWRALIAQSLPRGAGFIDSNNTQATITIAWADRNAVGSSSNCSASILGAMSATSTDVRCFNTVVSR